MVKLMHVHVTKLRKIMRYIGMLRNNGKNRLSIQIFFLYDFCIFSVIFDFLPFDWLSNITTPVLIG